MVFPACGGGRIKLRVQCDQPIELKASLYLDKLPSRLCPGTFAGERSWQLNVGSNEIGEMIPQSFDGQFCAWKFPPTPGVSLELCPRERAGFLCGRSGSPDYFEPMMEYEQTKDIHLYEPEQVQNGWGRPWGGPNQWCASPLDRTPWLELQWEQEVQVNEIRLYLDPDLTMELPSSRAKNWEASHLFAPRFGMPAQLVRDFSISAQGRDGQWTELCRVENNCQRMVKLKTETRRISRLRMDIRKTWGDKPPAVYEIRVYDRQDIL